jgi:hypothetical protein
MKKTEQENLLRKEKDKFIKTNNFGLHYKQWQ